MAANANPNPAPPNPWAPLVLSLDGGGIRGLSILYILREVMEHIKTLDDADTPQNQIEGGVQNHDVPLPCNYFDFIIGTSTGGLIAIMLGRLRMGVDDSIKQYWILANKIFVPPKKRRYFQHYSRRKVQDAAREAVIQHCRCHPNNGPCTGYELLRQHDYAEGVNRTCKVAVVTVRDGGATTFQKEKSADITTLFRSYDHSARPSVIGLEYNPRVLQRSVLTIPTACSCTSAAPSYFKSVEVNGRRYIDGGVEENNPAKVAWNEALQMVNPGGLPAQLFPKALVSIGTGRTKAQSRFGWTSFVQWTVKNITETQRNHNDVTGFAAAQPGSSYFRFDVPHNPHGLPYKGLADIGLAECEKKRIKPVVPAHAGAATPLTQCLQRVEQRDGPLRAQATETQKGGYKPQKYRYVTFNKLRDRTALYCGVGVRPDGTNVLTDIQSCAQLLRTQSLARKAGNQQWWNGFRTHPDPSHN
ncbi:FabD/lysophospholipase-like protein [Cenococcum geophilum 1.58]|uniref:FabD/lysophospholipase-like protein n=1 Tax=Cenococcum geophilum 1.58 TaxID=794803 RepID=A0ACC8EKW7_9PEZI|nr:FabD/lysophospholipase-like protein [Cenococcum geophilum 1.58]